MGPEWGALFARLVSLMDIARELSGISIFSVCLPSLSGPLKNKSQTTATPPTECGHTKLPQRIEG